MYGPLSSSEDLPFLPNRQVAFQDTEGPCSEQLGVFDEAGLNNFI